MVVDPATHTVNLGSAEARADVTVTGDVSFSDTLTIQSGGITVLNGDVRFGNGRRGCRGRRRRLLSHPQSAALLWLACGGERRCRHTRSFDVRHEQLHV